MWKQIITIAIFCFEVPLIINAQDTANIKFGNISEKDFASKVYAIDSNANAVVIAEIGSISIESNDKGGYSAVFNHYKRIHILNKNGFDAANVDISLYSNGNAGEKLDKLKAVTYNLEDGKVVQTNLDINTALFEDKIDKKWEEKKFTFPNVKTGSIIEYEYSTTSDFIEYIDPWKFQGKYPELWNKLTFIVPPSFRYAFLTQGDIAYDVNTRKELKGNAYTISIRRSRPIDFFDTGVGPGNIEHKWAIKNVPALKEESFIYTLENYLQKISFALIQQTILTNNQVDMETWRQADKWLLKSEHFGSQLNKNNDWLNDILEPLLVSASGKEDKARKIFDYVRGNFTCTSHNDLFTEKSLKDITKAGNGNVAEINLLLIAMLRHEDIDTDPVILSTRSNGIASPGYPIIGEYNYVICKARIDGKSIYLDASDPILGFNHIPLKCYNGIARVINGKADSLILSPDSVIESKKTAVFLSNDEKGSLIGFMQQKPDYYESLSLRELIKEKGIEQLESDIKKNFGSEIEISNFGIDSLNKNDYELRIHYDFDIKDDKKDLLYLTPMFGEVYKENPFKSAERKYPVEMPYPMDEIYNLQLEVPQGYVVDELPKSIVVKLNKQEDGIFEYRISQSGDNISLGSRIRLKRSFFMPDEYETLREFFNLIVKKQAEQIVFKKKK